MSISAVISGKGSRITTVRTTEKLSAALAKLYEEGIGALVVLDRWGKLAGVLSERDVIRALAQDGASALAYEVHELMTSDVTTCAPQDPIRAVMATMTVHRVRHL